MTKRLAVLVAGLCLTLSTLTATADAAAYFPQYTGVSGSIAAALESLNIDPSYANRVRIAAANGIIDYCGTAIQNTEMLQMLRQGRLVNPAASAMPTSPFFPVYTGGSPSIVAALNSLGVEAGFQYRAQIAAANGFTNYSGSAVQNTGLLRLLKQGRLIRPDGSIAPVPSAGLTAANLERVPFLRQNRNTCKATSAAMAINIILGTGQYSTADMIYSGVLCRNLDGDLYTGSDGSIYRTSYKTDGYVGSLRELESAVDTALSNGLPIVTAVHSAVSRHHWIVVVGRDSNGNYLAVDPARGGFGSMASQVKSMASMGYAFGLADYAQPHYGYISFERS